MHLNQINSGGSATAGIRAETYTEVLWTLKTIFGIKDVLNKVFIKNYIGFVKDYA